MAFSAASLSKRLKELPTPAGYWAAYSGGLDSHVLLHALASLSDRLAAPLHAIHVNHGLQSAAAGWEHHCATVCQQLAVPLEIVRLNLSPVPGESLEALARDRRYSALQPLIGEGGLLLTAHHQDDQAETVLLQLLRGAGPAGLAAMPLLDHFGEGYRARPLLGYRREELAAYAIDHQLSWIEDESNSDSAFDRNYLRREVFPLLRARWPSVARTFSRSARHCAESHQLIEARAGEDLQGLLDPLTATLDISRLSLFSAGRIRALLRYWITSSGFSLPSSVRLNRVISEVMEAGDQCSPLVCWPGAEIRRYRGALYLLAAEVDSDEEAVAVEPGRRWQLPGLLGEYRLQPGRGGIDPERLVGVKLEVRFGAAERRIRIMGRGQSTSLKNFFQERGVPPWQRSRLPLLYAGRELVAVADLCICEPYGVINDSPGLRPSWLQDAPASGGK